MVGLEIIPEGRSLADLLTAKLYFRSYGGSGGGRKGPQPQLPD